MNVEPGTFAVYADGACSPNPGKGGYGVIVVGEGKRRELSGGFQRTTNNRMELFSVIAGLRSIHQAHSHDLPIQSVTVYSDSRYVVDMYMRGHARKWKAHGWRRGKEPALNSDLWNALLSLCDKYGQHTVNFQWVRGHAEHPENTRCDELAVEARRLDNLPADEFFETLEKTAAAAVKVEQLSLFDAFAVSCSPPPLSPCRNPPSVLVYSGDDYTRINTLAPIDRCPSS